MDQASTIDALITGLAAAIPDRTFLIAGDDELSFAELHVAAQRWAHGLIGLGVEPGDRVCFLLPNRAETPVAWLGAILAGGIEVPLNVHHKRRLHGHVLADAAPALLVVDPALAPDLPEDLAPSVRAVVSVGDPAQLPSRWPVRELPSGDQALPQLEHWMPAGIQYTSGTTGRTKGALSSHRFMINFACTFAEAWHVDGDDVLFNPFPQFHSSGQVLGVLLSLVTGATLVMDERFSLSTYFDRVRQTGSTVGFALGGMLTLLDGLPPDPSDNDHRLRLLFSTPAPRDQVQRMERRFGFRVRQCYGATEQGIPVIQPYEDPVLGSTGRPLPHIEIRIADDHDAPLPAGQVGEILVRSREPYTLFSGYWNRPDATAEACRNLWFHSGDLGYLDEEGNLWYVDRRQDVIRRRGEFISAAELEAQVVEHPSVAEAAALGVSADVGGQDILLVLVPGEGQHVDPAEVVAYCEEHLAYFMVPRYVSVVEALPKTPNGKVQKAALREMGIAEGTWDREQSPRRVQATA